MTVALMADVATYLNISTRRLEADYTPVVFWWCVMAGMDVWN